MLRIGIDEAGLGPTLGPLVVAGTAFRVPGDDGAPFAAHLGHLLAEAVAAPGRPSKGRIVVGDSKAVFGAAHDPATLELPVLAFAAAASPTGAVPRDLDELLAAVAARPDERAAIPWYAGSAPTLPAFAEPSAVAAAAARLRDVLAASRVEFLGFAADVIPESRLNDDLARTPNKADVLFARSADVLDRLASRRREGEGLGAALDRLGGRRFYLPPLLARWPERFAWAIEETPESSRYRVALPGAEAEFRWLVGGDAAHLEIGLASMLAKYLRESFMHAFNAWFARICPDVAPTAGYAVDAKRWLDATRAARCAAGVPDEAIVRAR